MSPIRLTHILIWAIPTFSIWGCSIGGTYYVRNFTSDAARIILTFTEGENKVSDVPNFKLSREIKPIKRGLYKRLDESVSGRYLTPRTVQIEVPANSTVLFAMGSNMRMWGIETITIDSRNGLEVISSQDHEKLNIRMSGIGQYTGHLDIK